MWEEETTPQNNLKKAADYRNWKWYMKNQKRKTYKIEQLEHHSV